MESNGGSGSGTRRHEFESGERTESPNLRDFLRVKEDENVPSSLAGLTLRAVLTKDKAPSSNRTLLDVIIDDAAGGKDSKKRWKAFKDKLRLRRAGAAWTSTVHIPSSDVPIHPTINTIMSVPDSDEPTPAPAPARELNSLPSSRAMMLRRNLSRVPERQGSRLITSENSVVVEPTEQNEATHSADEEAPVRMSLMSLLAETDRQMGLDESKFTMDGEEEDEEEDEEETCGSGGVEYNNCCVCMVRHKGAAFIPCGHTFCRLCSRELWVQRGNCPLCNNYILEILDIF